MGGSDVALFRWIDGWPAGLHPWLTFFSVAQEGKPFRIAIGVIALVMIVRGGPARRAAIGALLAFPLADFLCTQAKNFLPMHRPFQELSDVVVRVGYADSMGTASSHAGNMAAVATAMTLGLGLRWGSVWIAVAALVGLSRVFVGVHYPSQVFLGYAIGIAAGVLIDAGGRRVWPPKPSATVVETERTSAQH